MRRILVLCLAACPILGAQNVAPSFQLTAEEAAKAKQLTETVKSARQRSDAATRAWEDFYRLFQAAHPDLSRLQFTSDFRLAFTRKPASGAGLVEATGFELSAEDKRKAESLFREAEQAEQALTEAQRNWRQFQWELVVKHVPAAEPGKGQLYNSPTTGQPAAVQPAFARGIALMPDYRTAVPAY